MVKVSHFWVLDLDSTFSVTSGHDILDLEYLIRQILLEKTTWNFEMFGEKLYQALLIGNTTSQTFICQPRSVAVAATLHDRL